MLLETVVIVGVVGVGLYFAKKYAPVQIQAVETKVEVDAENVITTVKTDFEKLAARSGAAIGAAMKLEFEKAAAAPVVVAPVVVPVVVAPVISVEPAPAVTPAS